MFILAAAFVLSGCGKGAAVPGDGDASGLPAQTLVETAELVFNDGVPIYIIEGIGPVSHPAGIANYALAYMGAEGNYVVGAERSDEYAANCIRWLTDKASVNGFGYTGWAYEYDSTYSDVTIQAPWYSAFGNACGIEALVRWYEKTGDTEALALASEAARMLFAPLEEGGLLCSRGGDIWFEEIPSTDREPSHILNGHMRTCIALRLLYDETGDRDVLNWYERGIDSLENWLPLYDAGYWLRYDLNPKKSGLLFRFNEPYGGTLTDLAVDEIRLTDPLTGESVTIDAGADGDMDTEAKAFLAGIDWQAESLPDGRTVRRILSAEAARDYGDVSETKPNCYFYLSLPSEWTDNLRTDWLEMTFVYKDEQPGHVMIEQRSIAPGEEFVAMRDGELLLTGSGEWREWTVPLRPTDLGWWVGNLYAEKHLQYLETLAAYSPELSSWTDTARGYYNGGLVKTDPDAVLEAAEIQTPREEAEAPVQSIIFGLSVDENGVVMQHNAKPGCEWVDYNGLRLPTEIDEGYYSPYVIAVQAIGSDGLWGFDTDYSELAQEYPVYGKYQWLLAATKEEQAKSEPAYRWLRENAVAAGDGLVWPGDFSNTYSDLTQEAGWQSAFWQRHIIDAFLADGDTETARKAAYAHGVPTEQGGLCSVARDGTLWFEEVPNNSHILNADMASIVALHTFSEQVRDIRVEQLYTDGLRSLRENLYRYDTGYWEKYDMNPNKNLVLELEWDAASDSPLIDTIYLYDPENAAATVINVGDEGDFAGTSYLAGMRWQTEQIEDGWTVRSFAQANPAEQTERAAYFHMALPETATGDCFQTPRYYFVIRYKDTAAGKLALKRRSIADGNHLVMLPMQEAVIACSGDGQWKTAVVALREQDLGWNMGYDYAKYHAEELGNLAELTGDWYFAQTSERWTYYLETELAAQKIRDMADDLRQSLVEGINRAVFADTTEQKALFIPATTWREREMAVPEEVCVLSLISTTGGVDTQRAAEFLSGTRDSLTLAPGTSFLVGLNGAHWLSEIEVDMKSDSPMKINITDYRAGVYEILRINESGKISFDGRKLCAYLQILCPQNGQEKTLQRIKVSGKPTLFEQLLPETIEDAVVLDSQDEQNPLNIYRVPLNQSVYWLADQLLEGTQHLTAHQKIMVFMDFISEWYIGFPDDNQYLGLNAYIGACGGYSNLLACLAKACGLDARVIGLYNYPSGHGHVVCEIYYDNDWHLYDPSYGSYYTTTPENTISPEVLGFDALSVGRGNATDVTCIITSPHRLNEDSYGLLGPQIYENAAPKGVIGPAFPMVFPLSMDLLSNGTSTVEQGDFSLAYQGINYLGAATTNNSYLWTLNGLKAGGSYEFIITGSALGGEVFDPFEARASSENARILSGERHSFDGNAPETMEWVVEFVPEGESAEILLTHDYMGSEFRYIFMDSFTLRKK